MGILPGVTLGWGLEGPRGLRGKAPVRVLVWVLRPDLSLPTTSSSRSVSPYEHRSGMQCTVITHPPSYYPCPNLSKFGANTCKNGVWRRGKCGDELGRELSAAMH